MITRVSDKTTFDAVLQDAIQKSSKKSAYVFYFGTELPAINQSWCQDCTISDPWIRSAAKTNGVDMIEVPVGNREEWKNNPDNYYRKRANLSVIPTLVKYNEEGKELARLQDQAECTDMDKLKTFFTQ